MAFVDSVLSVQELRRQVSGRVLTAADPEYEQQRRGWLLTIDQHPALIVVAQDAQDVVAAVNFAREHQLGISIQSTGHGLKYPADDAMLIVTTPMKGLQLEPQKCIVRAEAGVRWEQVIEAGAAYGLAPLSGTSPHVGIVGYTLGAGVGWMVRKFGLAVDSVLAIEVVTPDGVLRRASAAEKNGYNENSDLFWALRGGGGNFGVVTALEFSLYPVATIYGGSLTYPGHLAEEALRFYRDWVKNVPDEMTSSIIVMKLPAIPQIPEEMRGKTLVILRAVYAGNSAEGAALIQQWLDWQTPTNNTFREMPFREIGSVSSDSVDPSPGYPSSELLRELSDSAIKVILRHATNPTSPLIINELRHVGGAVSKVAKDANAIGNRDAEFYLTLSGIAPTPEVRAAMDTYIQRYTQELQPYLHGGTYPNFMRGSALRRRIKDAFLPESYARLQELKRQYDPDNLFRYSYDLTSAG